MVAVARTLLWAAFVLKYHASICFSFSSITTVIHHCLSAGQSCLRTSCRWKGCCLLSALQLFGLSVHHTTSAAVVQAVVSHLDYQDMQAALLACAEWHAAITVQLTCLRPRLLNAPRLASW